MLLLDFIKTFSLERAIIPSVVQPTALSAKMKVFKNLCARIEAGISSIGGEGLAHALAYRLATIIGQRFAFANYPSALKENLPPFKQLGTALNPRINFPCRYRNISVERARISRNAGIFVLQVKITNNGINGAI